MRILEDLYYGNIDLHIQHDQSDAQLRKIQVLLIRDEDKMRSMLDKEQTSGSSAARSWAANSPNCRSGRCSPKASASP